MSDDIDDPTLLTFLHNASWDVLLTDPEIKATCLEIRRKAELASGDIAAAIRIKLVVVGDGAVGKTSLLISFATDKFPTDYVPTVFENYTAQMKLKEDTILLHLWDTAGQEDYDRLRPLSYPGADLILLCFSTAHKPSLESIKVKWHPEVRHHIPKVPFFLVGTKLDLKEALDKDPNPEYETVKTEEGQALANELKALKYIEISAKTRQNLDYLFQEAVGVVLQNHVASGPTDSPNPQVDHEQKGSAKPHKKDCVVM
jgi:small GTP-binding protein